MRALSCRKAKQCSKPWITKGIRTSIKIKNKLYLSGNDTKYKFYRNKICSLTRISKKQYFCEYFQANINNMKKTWIGINNILNRKTKKSKSISALKDFKIKTHVQYSNQIPVDKTWSPTESSHKMKPEGHLG